MPRYRFPNGNEQDMAAETAALFDCVLVADEGYEERVAREQREANQRIAEAVAAKVELEDDDGNSLTTPVLSDADKAANDAAAAAELAAARGTPPVGAHAQVEGGV